LEREGGKGGREGGRKDGVLCPHPLSSFNNMCMKTKKTTTKKKEEEGETE
jgi:hypothetical protein